MLMSDRPQRVPSRVEKQVLTLLNGLAEGRDADGIAAFLQVRGIRGIPGMGASCPVAHYLGSIPGLELVYVSSTDTECGFESVHLMIRNPPQIREFIDNFDGWQYLELVPTIEQLRAEALAIVSAAKARMTVSSPAGALTSADQ